MVIAAQTPSTNSGAAAQLWSQRKQESAPSTERLHVSQLLEQSPDQEVAPAPALRQSKPLSSDQPTESLASLQGQQLLLESLSMRVVVRSTALASSPTSLQPPAPQSTRGLAELYARDNEALKSLSAKKQTGTGGSSPLGAI